MNRGVRVRPPYSLAGELGMVAEITPRPGSGVWVRIDNDGGAWLLYEEEIEVLEEGCNGTGRTGEALC